jgi:hypothetical protein
VGTDHNSRYWSGAHVLERLIQKKHDEVRVEEIVCRPVSAVRIRQKEIESKQLEGLLMRDIEHEAERKRASRSVTGQESSRGFLSDYYILKLEIGGSR